MKVLINTPETTKLGGVANHYKGLRPYWSEDVHYNIIAGRNGIPGPLLLPIDLIIFFFRLAFGSYDVVLLNPSLAKNALKRDAFFLKISCLFNVKKIVFFHGWESGLASKISKEKNWFIKSYDGADAFLVLSYGFKEQMENWGVSKPVVVVTTKVDDILVSEFNIDKKKTGKTVLFLARVEKKKGIFIALDAFSIVVANNPDARFLVAGSGGALKAAKAFVQERSIPNIHFLGNIYGDQLVQAFLNSDIYILPTTHGEGMPTSVLEAMAFGLPVIARPVGGLKDFFLDGEMGFISESLDPIWYAGCIDKLMSDPGLINKIAKYNHNYAKENFFASKVARHLEAILEGV